MGLYYLYRHIRNDKQIPFYVGIGKKTPKDLRFYEFNRAYSKKYRNIIWNGITRKTSYDVEILYESDNRDFIQEKEREFIALYGRIDLKTGTLANFTDGGDNGLNRSRIAIRKQLASAKKSGTYYEMVARMKKYAPQKGQHGSNINKKTFLYNKEGSFINEFASREDCAKYVKTSMEEICRCIRIKESHKGFLFLNEYSGDIIDISLFRIRNDIRKKCYKIHPVTGHIEKFNAIKDAAFSVGGDKSNINRYINKNILYRGFYFKTNIK